MLELLLVVDVQNAFCETNGRSIRDTKFISSITNSVINLKIAIELARKKNISVAYTRTVQIFENLPSTIQKRITKYTDKSNCISPGSYRANFFDITPLPSEKVFNKDRYDIFLNDDFEKYLHQKNTSKIIFCGFYTDICIDTAMRSAYQRGYETVLLSDATKSLFYNQKILEDFMNNFYDTKISTVKSYFDNH